MQQCTIPELANSKSCGAGDSRIQKHPIATVDRVPRLARQGRERGDGDENEQSLAHAVLLPRRACWYEAARIVNGQAVLVPSIVDRVESRRPSQTVMRGRTRWA